MTMEAPALAEPATDTPATEAGVEPAVRRGRPRNESCSAAILSATIELVAEVGFAALTVDAVSARAGVGKATIYRRWASKEALMLDAWMSCSPTVAVPDTGSLRADLQTLFVGVDRPLNDPTLQRVLPQMIAASRTDPEVREAYRSFVAERRKPVRTVLERAVARGELAADTDLQMVGDLLVAPMMYRWLITEGPVDDAFVGHVIDVVLAGLAA
jgi:AcrR family transcriptional regulator